METRITIAIAIACMLAQAQTSPTANAVEELKQYTDQLQRSPGDDALRTRLFRLAQTIKPRPDPPDAALEAAGKGQFLTEHAKSERDYLEAAAAFAQASQLAPWVPSYYFNMGLLLEKAESYQNAIKAFRWYLAADPSASDRADVIVRIGSLQAGADKAAQEAAIRADANRQRAAAATAESESKAREEADPVHRLLSPLNLSGGYRLLACSPNSIRDAHGVVSISLIRGCTEAEYRGSSWWESSFSVSLPDYSRRIMIEDGQIKVFGYGRDPDLIGTPVGSSASDIRWEWVGSRSGRRTVVWGRLSPDGKSLTFSLDRPLDDASFNPRLRYHYTMYERQ
jgi:tetratricopeptide (TPR) repeat protein